MKDIQADQRHLWGPRRSAVRSHGGNWTDDRSMPPRRCYQKLLQMRIIIGRQVRIKRSRRSCFHHKGRGGYRIHPTGKIGILGKYADFRRVTKDGVDPAISRCLLLLNQRCFTNGGNKTWVNGSREPWETWPKTNKSISWWLAWLMERQILPSTLEAVSQRTKP